MQKIIIQGGVPLHGDVVVSGAKNAVLPILCAALLADGPVEITNVPNLHDVATTARLLRELGADIRHDVEASRFLIDARDARGHVAPYDLVRTMRASVLVLGPLLARHGAAEVSLPGGCAIGSRPVDLHIQAMQALGAEVEVEHGYIKARAQRLRGGHIEFPMPSVGATENALMAASLAAGTTVIDNAAREPEIVDLCAMLNSMGARIDGAGTSTITVDGVDSLSPTEHTVVGDRIVAGTWAYAAAMTQGDITVTGAAPGHLHLALSKLKLAGANVETYDNGFRVRMDQRPRAVDYQTLPYPGFPTDLQPMAIALATIADGVSVITENVFEARFRFVDEMLRLGADANVDGHHVMLRGVDNLSSTDVWSSDIRAGAGLVLAGLVADGVTTVHEVHHIDRGYPAFVEQLNALGAHVERA